jgi:hypothetical protein
MRPLVGPRSRGPGWQPQIVALPVAGTAGPKLRDAGKQSKVAGRRHRHKVQGSKLNVAALSFFRLFPATCSSLPFCRPLHFGAIDRLHLHHCRHPAFRFVIIIGVLDPKEKCFCSISARQNELSYDLVLVEV